MAFCHNFGVMKKPETLQEAIKFFSDEQVCIDTVASLRWANGAECPACGHKEHYYLKTQKRWKCKECYKQFTVKLGTIFEDSPLGLDKWLIALWMLVNCKNGISSYELADTLGISQKSAWFMLHRLRLALQNKSLDKFGGGGTPVEADETYIGGKVKNMHKKLEIIKKRNAIPDWKATVSNRYYGKVPVAGLLDRESRKVRATVVPNVRRAVLQKHILDNVKPDSAIFTDEALAYHGLAEKQYVHEFVNHLQGYVRGEVHTNGIENFWSLLKRGLNGTYVSVEPFHLFRYVDEQVYRFNHRKDASGNKITNAERFATALTQVAGKRLTFAEATGKM
jgi:transposase-like protein